MKTAPFRLQVFELSQDTSSVKYVFTYNAKQNQGMLNDRAWLHHPLGLIISFREGCQSSSFLVRYCDKDSIG